MNELSLFNTLFNDDGYTFPTYYAQRSQVPSVDVTENKTGYVLSMDLPGRTENDVEISLKDDILTISSVKQAETQKEETKASDCTWLIRERKTSQFKRSFTMPKDINSDDVNATFKNGVLKVAIGKKPNAAERKIAINVA